MKRTIIIALIFTVGMAIIINPADAQDLSSFRDDYMRTDGNFAYRLAILHAMQESGVTGTEEFYHDALKYLLIRAPDINNNKNEQEAAEKALIILSQALGNAKYTEAATDLWYAVETFDVVREPPFAPNEGLAMQAALIALGDIDGREFIPHIVQRLTDYNTQTYKNAETRRRVQTAVIGCIQALETFKDISGYRPVFFAYTGSWDPMVKQIAGRALPNITDDPSEVIIEIIRDPSITPPIKLTAWYEMQKTSAPGSSKAKVAANALEIGWLFQTSNRAMRANLSELRKQAIDVIRQHGIEGDVDVYTYLERSYSANFINNSPDYDEIAGALNALAELKTDEAVRLLHKFLSELHGRRRSGPWKDKERRLFEWVISCIGFTGTNSQDVRLLLLTITRTDQYTAQEKNMASNALSKMGA